MWIKAQMNFSSYIVLSTLVVFGVVAHVPSSVAALPGLWEVSE